MNIINEENFVHKEEILIKKFAQIAWTKLFRQVADRMQTSLLNANILRELCT